MKLPDLGSTSAPDLVPLSVGNGDIAYIGADGSVRVERVRTPIVPAPSTIRPGNWGSFETMPGLKNASRAWYVSELARGWYAGHPLSEDSAVPFRVDVAWQQFAWPIRTVEAAFDLDRKHRWDGKAPWGCAYKEPFVGWVSHR